MKLPFGLGRLEFRDDSYTDAVIAALTDRAQSGDVRTGYLSSEEHAAGLWARAMASARFTPDTIATRALTPDVMASIGRNLIRNGESLHEITVEGGVVTLKQSSNWTVEGGAHWQYQADFAEPSQTASRLLDADRVIHIRWAVNPQEPWRGVGPFSSGRDTRSLAANLEKQLSREAGGPAGTLIPSPESSDLTDLQKDINKLTGQVTFAPSFAGGHGSGAATAPAKDYGLVRLGLNVPASTPALRRMVNLDLLAAAGIPPALADPSDQVSSRESWRQFIHAAVLPVARMIEREVAVKLEVPDFALDFSELQASDIQGRARALGSMVKAGVDIEEAMRLAGLE